MKVSIDFVNAPIPAAVEEVVDEGPDVKTFVIRYSRSREVLPGQFVMIFPDRMWEIPISVAHASRETIHLTVARVGRVTSALFRLGGGDRVGVRGPYGRPWPVDILRGHRVLFVVGGLGLAPVRMAIEQLGDVTLVYGARNPSLLLYRNLYRSWEKEGKRILLTVDRPDGKWRGHVGVVTTLLDGNLVKSHDYAVVAGPPIMMKFASRMLEELGMDSDRIFLTLENHMKCGVGLCGHCRIGDRYVCVDGPVFSLSEIRNLEGWASGEVI